MQEDWSTWETRMGLVLALILLGFMVYSLIRTF